LQEVVHLAQKLTPFEELDGVEGISCSLTDKLRCSAILLKDQSICLFSPVTGLHPAVLESLTIIGEVKFLFAPNHYHNKGLREYAGAFPEASLCATDAASTRLQKATGLDFQTLEKLETLLPKNIRLLFPEGLKTGEAWLRIETATTVAWLVVDAFMGSESADKPELLKTFPSYGVGDKKVYGAWVRNQIEKDQPRILVPCHGPVIRSDSLSDQLNQLVDNVF